MPRQSRPGCSNDAGASPSNEIVCLKAVMMAQKKSERRIFPLARLALPPIFSGEGRKATLLALLERDSCYRYHWPGFTVATSLFICRSNMSCPAHISLQDTVSALHVDGEKACDVSKL
jgi:hypothetical protein